MFSFYCFLVKLFCFEKIGSKFALFLLKSSLNQNQYCISNIRAKKVLQSNKSVELSQSKLKWPRHFHTFMISGVVHFDNRQARWQKSFTASLTNISFWVTK